MCLCRFKLDEPIYDLNNTLRTIFEDTPKIPTYLVAIAILNKKDFDVASITSYTGKKVI